MKCLFASPNPSRTGIKDQTFFHVGLLLTDILSVQILFSPFSVNSKYAERIFIKKTISVGKGITPQLIFSKYCPFTVASHFRVFCIFSENSENMRKVLKRTVA